MTPDQSHLVSRALHRGRRRDALRHRLESFDCRFTSVLQGFVALSEPVIARALPPRSSGRLRDDPTRQTERQRRATGGSAQTHDVTRPALSPRPSRQTAQRGRVHRPSLGLEAHAPTRTTMKASRQTDPRLLLPDLERRGHAATRSRARHACPARTRRCTPPAQSGAGTNSLDGE